MNEWLKNSLQKIWDEILKNLGAVIVAFVLSGGYLVALKYLTKFQNWVNGVPSQWFLTPLVLLIVLVGVLTRINLRQNRQLDEIRTQQPVENEGSRLVTHLGVWWKVFPASRYIEDFPYCPCCDPPGKLVQVEWFEHELYKCPRTDTEIKLYDGVPRKRRDVLEGLYQSYCHDQGSAFYDSFHKELSRRKELSPDTDENEIFEKMLQSKPLSRIPSAEREEILSRHPSPMRFAHFVSRYYNRYAKYIEAVDDDA